tara:strand:- start:352 stop:534 length:183 start_codon:yes stop_codon:yes gene_type:complete
MSNTLTAKDFLEVCEYISQDNDTVYIDEEALVKCMEQYAVYHANTFTAVNRPQTNNYKKK